MKWKYGKYNTVRKRTIKILSDKKFFMIIKALIIVTYLNTLYITKSELWTFSPTPVSWNMTDRETVSKNMLILFKRLQIRKGIGRGYKLFTCIFLHVSYKLGLYNNVHSQIMQSVYSLTDIILFITFDQWNGEIYFRVYKLKIK